jgi:hypothetical protein
MTDVSRFLEVQFGLHSSVSDFSTTSGTATNILCTSAAVLPRARNVIERPLYAPDGRKFPRIHGAKDIGAINISMEMRGMSNSTCGAVSTYNVM